MEIELYAHGSDRTSLWNALADHGIVTFDPETGEPIPAIRNATTGLQEFQWDEIGDIAAINEIRDPETDEIIVPGVMHGRWFVNFRCWGDFANLITAGKAQTDADGNLLPLFERANLREMFPTLTDYATDEDANAPPGLMGSSGVKFYDPMALATRERVWA